ncbi:NADP-binding protein [Dacryopinax primogenitus]|uniref:NADP-binding protein n=1 Tax=Dacryopinax primogenitus (strain DJM 731) TaxID=1858805 RepID=M5FVW1_DACPD|nr:NADP-binding protein [Dacryopinax primogenitus]EJT97501.1 NADP-binding protein [Dacryopinax primogenitus]
MPGPDFNTTSFGLLRDQVVVITGASQGIGKGIALGCARQGAHVVLHYLGNEQTAKDVDEIVKEIRNIDPTRKTVVVGGDISNPTTSTRIVEESLKTFGRIDCLVSNAGICPFYSFLDIPHDVWNLTRSVNLDGTFYVVQVESRRLACAKQMKGQTPQGGSIVAVSSISALVGGGQQAHYTPTKAGVKSLMESCAISLAPYHIRCNSVLPGTIETPINAEDLSRPEKRQHMEGRVPLGRLGRPEDLAGPTIFLLSTMSSYVTGASVLVDGGAFVNLQ